MNICFLLGGFQGNGGIGRVTSVLARELCKKSDLNIHTIAYCQTNAPLIYELSDEIQQHVLFSENVSMTKALLLKNAVKKLKKLVKDNKIDILIACGALYYPLAILATKRTGCKCYCWEHTNPATTADHKFQNVCRKYAVRKADKIILLTKAAKEYYVRMLKASPEKVFQVYNPVDSKAFQSNRYDVNSKKIISVGRLSYQKNFELLLDIAKDILPLYPDWTWDIYGEGELREKLFKIADSYNLIGRINFKGQVSDLYSRYREYAFLVMTSRYEGFPMSLVEGGANRLPLISFDIETGPNEIIETGKNGFLVDRENAEEMKRKIEILISDPVLRMQMAEQVYLKMQDFEINKIVSDWCQLCKE